jgi:hypothetical protein
MSSRRIRGNLIPGEIFHAANCQKRYIFSKGQLCKFQGEKHRDCVGLRSPTVCQTEFIASTLQISLCRLEPNPKNIYASNDRKLLERVICPTTLPTHAGESLKTSTGFYWCVEDNFKTGLHDNAKKNASCDVHIFPKPFIPERFMYSSSCYYISTAGDPCAP